MTAACDDTLEDERGDVPGWVLITLMTAGLVVVIWALAGSGARRALRAGDLAASPASDGRARHPVPPRASLADDRGSSPVEFVLVGTLLTVLTLGVLQLGLAVYVRNVVHDAAVEGAYHAALADTSLEDGAARTRAIIARTVGDEYASVTAQEIPGRSARAAASRSSR